MKVINMPLFMLTMVWLIQSSDAFYINSSGILNSDYYHGYNSKTSQALSTVTPVAIPPMTDKVFEPYFDTEMPSNVTAQVGRTAYLGCRVRNLGNKSVSWIRHRDVHILTVGSYTYTSDQRFQANHNLETDEWTLIVKWTQKRDAGIYECQVNTQPVTSYFVELGVAVPTAQILGEPDLHVDKGSTINLTCVIHYSSEVSAYIFWYHYDDVISYDSSRGGVTVITEKGEITISYLLIQNADISDSGKYSCSPSNADVASIRVHVLNDLVISASSTPLHVTKWQGIGYSNCSNQSISNNTCERPAAMQTGSSGLSNSFYNIIILLIIRTIYYQLFLSTYLETTIFSLR